MFKLNFHFITNNTFSIWFWSQQTEIESKEHYILKPILQYTPQFIFGFLKYLYYKNSNQLNLNIGFIYIRVYSATTFNLRYQTINISIYISTDFDFYWCWVVDNNIQTTSATNNIFLFKKKGTHVYEAITRWKIDVKPVKRE